MKLKSLLAAAHCLPLLVFPISSWSQIVGEIVSGHVEIEVARGGGVYAKVPLPAGNWEVVDSAVRKSTGNTDADLRDVRLLQFSSGPTGRRLQHAFEITMKVGGPNINWNDEPCKVTPVLAKNDYGTRLFKQKCLTLMSDRFLQNNNRVTARALEDLSNRRIQHDFNSLAVAYSRFGDFGYFLVIKQHFFPSNYGMENPRLAILNESPWHPSRVTGSPEHQRLVDAIFMYAEAAASHFDRAYMREESESFPAFEFK